MRFPIEKVNKLFINEFLDMKYNRPEVLLLEDEGPEEKKVRKMKEEMRKYATEIEMREVINRKVMKLRCDLIYGPEKGGQYLNEPLDFNYQ